VAAQSGQLTSSETEKGQSGKRENCEKDFVSKYSSIAGVLYLYNDSMSAKGNREPDWESEKVAPTGSCKC